MPTGTIMRQTSRAGGPMRSRSTRVSLQPALPRQRSTRDEIQIVVLRLPAEPAADAVGGRDQRRRVAGAPWLFHIRDRRSLRASDRGQYLAHRIAVAVAAVQRGRSTAVAQITERIKMRARKVGDVDVVAHAGAVGGCVIGAENRKSRALAQHSLAGDLQQQRGVLRGLANPPGGIATGDVEIPQRHVTRTTGAARSRSIHSLISLDEPYGLIGAVGVSSLATPPGGMPYTAAVEENTICLMPASLQHASRLRVAQVLLP